MKRTIVGLLACGLTCGATAQTWQKVYPPEPQTGRWAAVTKVPGSGGAWHIAGDGKVLRSSDLNTFTTEINTPDINWRGIATVRITQTGYTVLVTGGSTLASTDTSMPNGYAFSVLPAGVSSAGAIACNSDVQNGGCVVAAGGQILYGQYTDFAARFANISNHNANFTNGRLFVTGYGGGVSAWDGAEWIDSNASFADVYNVAYGPDGQGGEHYVTAGDAGAISLSTALSEWTLTQPLGLFYAKSIIYAEGRYLAVGQFLPDPQVSFIESVDGVNWTSGEVLSGAATIYDLQYIAGNYIALGDNREIWVRRPEELHADGFE